MTATINPTATPGTQDHAKIAPKGLVQRFIFWKLSAFEKATGTTADEGRFMANVSLRAFFKYMKFAKLAQYRHALPADASHIAHLVATRAEDCGSCVKISVTFALRDGVSRDIMRAVLERRPDDLPPHLADVYRFAESVVSGADDEELRQRVRSRYGDEGLIEMGIGMATARAFPTVKRTIGYAKSCSLVPVTV